jgi:hypothetical protein
MFDGGLVDNCGLSGFNMARVGIARGGSRCRDR